MYFADRFTMWMKTKSILRQPSIRRCSSTFYYRQSYFTRVTAWKRLDHWAEYYLASHLLIFTFAEILLSQSGCHPDVCHCGDHLVGLSDRWLHVRLCETDAKVLEQQFHIPGHSILWSPDFAHRSAHHSSHIQRSPSWRKPICASLGRICAQRCRGHCPKRVIVFIFVIYFRSLGLISIDFFAEPFKTMVNITPILGNSKLQLSCAR